jgi:hypothetical protein
LNPAFIKTFGYDLDVIPTLSDWWPKAYPETEYRNWVAKEWEIRPKKAKLAGSPFEPMELKICSKGAEIRFALVSKVIVSSGYSKDPVIAKYKSEGFSDFITRPYRILDMSKTMNDVLAGLN